MYNNVKNIRRKDVTPDMIGKPYLLADTSLRTTDWGEDFQFLDNYYNEKPQIAMNEITKDIYLVDNLLTQSQCASIISKAKKLDLQYCCYGEERNNSRLVLFDEKFADFLWDYNICEQLEKHIGDAEIHPFGFDAVRGKWELSGVNQAMRLNRYSGKKKEFFGPHRDAPFCPNGDKRSLYTMLIYLNDDFGGGETKFYAPKDPSIDTKGFTIKEEIEKHGNLEDGFTSYTVSPKTGNALIFKQNLIHEGCKLAASDKYKFVIKTDIMVERVDKKLGFCPPKHEFDDYQNCLHLFRQAQQHELTGSNQEANECYEKSLSFRYYHPSYLLKSNFSKLKEVNDVPIPETFDSQISMTSTSSIHSQSNPFTIFPQNIWNRIMVLIRNDKAIHSLCEVFPLLNIERKRIIFQRVTPKVDHHSGIYTKFSYDNGHFVTASLENCIKVCAVYSMCLLGNTPKDTHYLVNYDKETKNATTVQLNDLLYGVFANELVPGTVFKVAQREKDKQPNADLYHSVDRKFMTKHFDRDDIGIDVESEIRSHLKFLDLDSDSEDEKEEPNETEEKKKMTNTKIEGSNVSQEQNEQKACDSETSEIESDSVSSLSDSESDSETKLTESDIWNFCCNKPYYLRDYYSRYYLGTFDTHYEYCKNELPYKEEGDPYDTNACDFDVINEPEDQWHEFFSGYESMETVDYSPDYVPVPHVGPGAAIIRKTNAPVTMDYGEICICNFKAVGGLFSKSCSTHTFNHVIADFSKIKLFIEKEIAYAYGTPDQKNLASLLKWVKHFTEELFDLEMYKVNIEEMEEILSSFNHAACQCLFPRYRIDDYVNLSSYPMLDTIVVIVAKNKIDPGEVYICTGYAGIAAL